jgi:capsid portal protein
VLGNGYLEWRENQLGDKLVLRHALAKYMRVGIQPGRFFFVTDLQSPHEFKAGSILHLRKPDLHQVIYGVPGHLGAMQSAQLNESATLFRRRYYNNGSHAGFILYATDPAQSQGTLTPCASSWPRRRTAATSASLLLCTRRQERRPAADPHQ